MVHKAKHSVKTSGNYKWVEMDGETISLEHNTNRTENVRLSGEGELEIVALRESFEGNEYTSARIRSQESFALPGSRFEARIKLPKDKDYGLLFGFLAALFEEEGWPFCGEVDIMEFRGENPDEYLTTVHGPGFAGGASVGGDTHDVELDLSEDHIPMLWKSITNTLHGILTMNVYT